MGHIYNHGSFKLVNLNLSKMFKNSKGTKLYNKVTNNNHVMVEWCFLHAP